MDWQLISTAPKDGTPVLGYVLQDAWGEKRHQTHIVWFCPDSGAWQGGLDGWPPTHWMPMPPSPADAATGAVVKDEWKLVPVEPTETMLKAARQAVVDFQESTPLPIGFDQRGNLVRAAIYRAMLAASPAPPTDAGRAALAGETDGGRDG